MPDVMDAVAELLREAAETIVLPLFGQLAAAPEEKSPGEWVTVADRAAEAFLSPALERLIPGSLVVGEEAASADRAIMARLGAPGEVWLVDPVDGTANFAAGRGPFSMMIALVRDGETAAAWMLDPLSGQLARAQRGAGAWLDGQKVVAGQDAPPLASLKGAVLRRFLPAPFAAHVSSAEALFAEISAGVGCAGADYPRIASGGMDFSLYWRTLPWDHAPGVLFAAEAGAAARRLDGTGYRPAQHVREGLLVARNAEIWRQAAKALVPA